MKASEAKRHVKHLIETGSLFPGSSDLAYAAVMVLTNQLVSNFRDFPDMERDWRRLADAVELMPEDFI